MSTAMLMDSLPVSHQGSPILKLLVIFVCVKFIKNTMTQLFKFLEKTSFLENSSLIINSYEFLQNTFISSVRSFRPILAWNFTILFAGLTEISRVFFLSSGLLV